MRVELKQCQCPFINRMLNYCCANWNNHRFCIIITQSSLVSDRSWLCSIYRTLWMQTLIWLTNVSIALSKQFACKFSFSFRISAWFAVCVCVCAVCVCVRRVCVLQFLQYHVTNELYNSFRLQRAGYKTDLLYPNQRYIHFVMSLASI